MCELNVRLKEHVGRMFKLWTTEQWAETALCGLWQSVRHTWTDPEPLKAREATLKPGLKDEFPSSFSHCHTNNLQIFSRRTIPSRSHDVSPLLQSFYFTPPPPTPILPYFPLFYLSPALYFDFSLRPTSVPLLLCVLSQPLRVLCIPQIQCHPFILHQETLTPIFWRLHKTAQPHDPEDEGRIESDGQRHGRELEPETDEGVLASVWSENICRRSGKVWRQPQTFLDWD